MKVGFIGLGAMGRGIAANLQRAGFALVVHDVSKAAAESLLHDGAVWKATPSELATECTLIFTSLPTPADVEQVGLRADGVASGASPGTAWFDLSTSGLSTVRELRRLLSERNIDFLDAPVSGGPAGAASGKLAIWVGGRRSVFEQYKPVLDAIADEPRYIGEIGSGTIAKLVNNMASTAINTVMAEVLTMGVRAGLDLLPLWAAIRSSVAGRKRTYDNIARRMLQGRFDPPNFALRLLQKDISLALQVGREHGVPMKLCSLVAEDIAEAMDRNWGGRDSQSFLLLQQERAGVPPFKLTDAEVASVLGPGS
jgi:3-hydroxyisobutyrate dehydrogenase